MDEHKVVLDETKEKFNALKKIMNELRAAEVCTFYSAKLSIYLLAMQYTCQYNNNKFQLLGTICLYMAFMC